MKTKHKVIEAGWSAIEDVWEIIRKQEKKGWSLVSHHSHVFVFKKKKK